MKVSELGVRLAWIKVLTMDLKSVELLVLMKVEKWVLRLAELKVLKLVEM